MQVQAVKKLLWGVGAVPTWKVTSGPPPGLTEVDDNTDLHFLQPPEQSSILKLSHTQNSKISPNDWQRIDNVCFL